MKDFLFAELVNSTGAGFLPCPFLFHHFKNLQIMRPDEFHFHSVKTWNEMEEGDFFKLTADGYLCRCDFIKNKKMECHILEILKAGNAFVLPFDDHFNPKFLIHKKTEL